MPDSSRPHLLYVAWGYPPSRSSGTYRLLATANSFARAGWQVTVLTSTRDAFELVTGADRSLEALIDPSIHVERVPFPHAAAASADIRTWSRLRAYAPEVWNTIQGRKTFREFPERGYGLWRPVLEQASERIHASNAVDLTIGSANPNVIHTAGYRLQAKYGVPYIMDYRDTWQLDMYSGRRTLRDRSPAAQWERRFIEAAHEMWFVNDPIRQWHAELYPFAADRMFVVPNGFDPEFVGEPSAPRMDRDKGLVFGNIGVMTRQTPIPVLVDAWKSVRASSAALANATLDLYGYLGHQGNDDGGLLPVISAAAGDGVSYLGPAAKANIAGIYRKLDALVLPLGTSRFMTSGKVFEYMATGLPIVSVHDPINAVSQTLSGYPAWFPSESLSAASVSQAIGSAAKYARHQTMDERVAAREWASRYERSTIMRPVAERLLAEVAARRTSR